jgi:hypothetical protein
MKHKRYRPTNRKSFTHRQVGRNKDNKEINKQKDIRRKMTKK